MQSQQGVRSCHHCRESSHRYDMVPLQIQVCTHSKAARTIASDLIPMSNGNNRIHSWISCSCHGYQPLMFCGFRLQTKMTILSLSKGGAARPSGPAKAGPLFGQVLTFFLFCSNRSLKSDHTSQDHLSPFQNGHLGKQRLFNVPSKQTGSVPGIGFTMRKPQILLCVFYAQRPSSRRR